MSKNFHKPEDLNNFDYEKNLGDPGKYPFTRGIHRDMYLGRPWTIRQFSGLGQAEDTNKRFKYLLERGETGLSVAFHLPTLYGYDSDNPLAEDEIGLDGVAIDSLKDMEILFDGIPLDKISTSMTINSTAIIALAMYVVIGEKQGVDSYSLQGTVQNDILKEYIAQNTYIFPPQPSMRLIIDIIEYCTKNIPLWNTISVSGYHIREAGSTVVQELAFTLADAITYVQAAVDRGLDVDSFAPRISFFFNSHNDFFEEVAKFRAARKMWAKIMKEKFKAKNEKSWKLRFHTQTAGCSLTARQPLNNIVRVAYQALAAVLGGTQSLHTNSYDEQICLPSEEAVTIALRTQQIIAHETGVTNMIDPLAGSYLVEHLTEEMEEKANEYLAKIVAMGGMIKAIENGFPQNEIANAAFKHQRNVESKKTIVVGQNEFVDGEFPKLSFKIDPHVKERQIERLRMVKASRDNEAVQNSLRKVRRAALSGENLFPSVLEAVKAYVTIGEICDILRGVFGEYQPDGTF
jgi:methylmalonyl-CoA mutase N-terminal domain/subunit